MAPLVCQQAGKLESRAINVWFVIDTGSPFTCLSVKTLEALLGCGPGNATHSLYNIAIQERKSRIECHVSKAHSQEVNILGADAMRKLKLSILVDWNTDDFKLTRQ